MSEEKNTTADYDKINSSADETIEKPSCIDNLKEKLNDQDFQQQMSVSYLND